MRVGGQRGKNEMEIGQIVRGRKEKVRVMRRRGKREMREK